MSRNPAGITSTTDRGGEWAGRPRLVSWFARRDAARTRGRGHLRYEGRARTRPLIASLASGTRLHFLTPLVPAVPWVAIRPPVPDSPRQGGFEISEDDGAGAGLQEAQDLHLRLLTD